MNRYIGVGALLLFTACQTSYTPARLGLRGESCQARNDCEAGLACVSQICVQNDFVVAASSQSCDVIECTADVDCCVLSTLCEGLQTDCRAGDTVACDDFAAQCECEQKCNDENRCYLACADDSECGIEFCEAGACVGCRNTDDCLGGLVCSGSECVEPCESDSDCPYFHQCETGICEEVGCQSDRECIAFTENPNAVCEEREGGPVCEVPCLNDAECNPEADYNFQACVDGRCVHIGCTSDEECRIALDIQPHSDTQVVCR